jgi:RNA-binding protein
LQRLGRVINVTPSQKFIVKVEQTPKIGSNVVDESLKNVGSVFDIIGPVASPYAVIRPVIKELAKLTNKQLYLLPTKKVRSRD